MTAIGFPTSHIATCETCLISKVPNCTDFNLLAGVQLHAFISADILDVYCRRLQAALACAYTRGRLNRCPLIYRLPFDSQQGVVDVVCTNRREEYLKSSQCFSRQEVKQHITSTCLPVMASSKVVSADRCSTLAWVLECARNKVLMTDGCDSADSELMVDLVLRFIQPKSIKPHSKQLTCTTLGSNVGEYSQ
ncbi:unnamed protein product [Candidula unifasciata]|uniref:Uncharacterized protein n=1 Tax=Candidula unifasciata TaxID=100452 RepID=A0A8S3ZIJ1_9EUPU|nr:unnamed protein product [Candidula unifasciata]